MPDRLLIDTDVIIDYLRGLSEAVGYLQARQEVLLISNVTVAELYAGVRDGSERPILDAFVATFVRLPVDEATARQGGLYRRDYARSHGVGLADALIAATAEAAGATLVTLNEKHFPMLDDIIVPYRKP